MTTVEVYIQRALEANPLRDQILRDIIQSLQLPPGSRGLDAGCGIGLQAMLLAEAVESAGKIIGLDVLPGLPAYGHAHVQQAGFTDQITFCAGDISRLPFEDQSFDWAWSADCIGYPARDLLPLLTELIRVLKPGGSVTLAGWSSQQLLPGYPLLEARLNATCSGYLPFLREQQPEQNFLRAKRWLRKAGLEEIYARTFVRDIQAPLTSGERLALISLFNMLWGQPQPEVTQEDWIEYQRLCSPGSPDFILDSHEYYAFFTYSLFQGKLPGN